MKTNFKTTGSNVQKAVIKSLAIVISLVLISFAVNAQNFWKTLLENNSFNEIAMFMVELKPASTANENAKVNTMDANAFAAFMETETEETLELKEWMINDNYFTPAAAFSTEVDFESPLELENWMTDGKYFASNAITFENDTEKLLVLENWMVDNTFWKR